MSFSEVIDLQYYSRLLIKLAEFELQFCETKASKIWRGSSVLHQERCISLIYSSFVLRRPYADLAFEWISLQQTNSVTASECFVFT